MIAMLIIAYLIGSLSFAIITSKIFKLADPRSYGSKNPGATNMLRGGNKKAALVTFLGDFIKGLLVIIIARFIFLNNEHLDTILALSGIFVVLGHIYPIFFKFKGGKGVATAFGVMFGLNIYLAILAFVTWLIIFFIFRISSLAAIITFIIAPIYTFFVIGNNAYFGAILVITIFILFTHRLNIYKLITQQEHKFENSKDSNKTQ